MPPGSPAWSRAAFDATDTAGHAAAIDEVFDGGDVDIVLLAFGVLGDQAEAEADPDAAVTVATTNYTGAVSAGLRVATRLRMQGHGMLVVLSSVAGDRARRTNYVYGSTKAGLDAFAQGLGDALHGSGARVLIVRPGFVRTRMTAGMTEAPMTINPQDVGAHHRHGTAQGPRDRLRARPPAIRHGRPEVPAATALPQAPDLGGRRRFDGITPARRVT